MWLLPKLEKCYLLLPKLHVLEPSHAMVSEIKSHYPLLSELLISSYVMISEI